MTVEQRAEEQEPSQPFQLLAVASSAGGIPLAEIAPLVCRLVEAGRT